MVAGAGTLATALTTFATTANPPEIAQGYVFHDRSGRGSRRPGDPGIANVLVSNGAEVVWTDADGRWQLPAPAGGDVFVIKPAGWSVARGPVGLMRSSQRVTAPSPTTPTKAMRSRLPSIDFALRPVHETEVFKVALVADTQPQSNLELDYLRDSVLAVVAQSEAAFAINHGDIVADNAALYPRYLQLVAATGMPWHHCPGNHDMNHADKIGSDCFETWRSVFGPTSYAFQHGRATFIVLNNVVRLPPGQLTTSGYNYQGALGERQLRFVRNLLAMVPADHLVVLSMHIPLVGFEDPNDASGRTEDCRELLRLLSGRPHTVSFAGHTHTTEHHYLGAGHGFSGPGLHHHHVLTTACGSWWSGPLDHQGQPLASNRDGTPKGFHMLSVDGNRYTTQLVPVGHVGHPQMRISLVAAPATKAVDPAAAGGRSSFSLPVDQLATAALVVNVFDGGPRTEVSFVAHSGAAQDAAATTAMTPMERKVMPDPFTVAHYARHKSELKPWVEATSASHVWRAPLPTNLQPGVHRICVTVRDEYGRSQKAATIIEITPRRAISTERETAAVDA